MKLKYELQPIALWAISTYAVYCHLDNGRKCSAYEESDCFAGIAGDIATNHTKPIVNSKETIFFRMSFQYQKTGQAKRL